MLGKPIQTTYTSLPNSVVRVSVTLYPKAPYNTDPIVTTRTFAPQFEESETNATAMEYIQYKDGEFAMGMTQQEAERMAIPEEVYQECARIVDELNDK